MTASPFGPSNSLRGRVTCIALVRTDLGHPLASTVSFAHWHTRCIHLIQFYGTSHRTIHQLSFLPSSSVFQYCTKYPCKKYISRKIDDGLFVVVSPKLKSYLEFSQVA